MRAPPRAPVVARAPRHWSRWCVADNANHIKRGRWCPVCGGKKKSTIGEMKEIAKERGGKCLSKEYISTHSPLIWQCKEGHQWEAVPGNIKKGSWCPVCGGTQKGTIEQMQEIARERGGKCLSKIYMNAYSKLTWQCKEGHQWEAVPGEIKRGRWCPACAGKRWTLTIP